jgi:secondary thiamine-phosphate synthase enzyme
MRLDVRTTNREELVDVTRDVTRALSESGLYNGLLIVYCPHTTAGVTINEHADPDVAEDILTWLGRTCPRGGEWRHCEGNSDGHVKATLVGSSVTIPVDEGRMQLGMWQGVFFCEFDGPRDRTLEVRVVGDRG